MELTILIIFLFFWYFTKGSSTMKYNKSEYKGMTGNTYESVVKDKGKIGEMLTFSEMSRLPGTKRIFANLYIPQRDGTLTEIDLILINRTGIYVIESKNYSGWIFGDPNGFKWTQTLPNGEKNRFYNPIWQNQGHIDALLKVLPDVRREYFHSYIVFSDRCELKAVTSTHEAIVTKRQDLVEKMTDRYNSSRIIFNEDNIEQYAEALQTFASVSQEEKESHIERVRGMRN